MKRMAVSNVLVVGLQGLGAEIGTPSLYCQRMLGRLADMIVLEAKNLALAGVKSVTVFDPEPVTVQDLGTQVRCDAFSSAKCSLA